jgi:basic amino acid/polyamine antiporter, APA family
MPEPDVGMTPASDEAESGLRRTVGPLGASLSGIGIVLGAGIYVLVGEASGEAGNAVWAAFLLAAFLAAATGLSYAELTAMIPESGAAAAYADEAFGSRAAFVTGWMDVIVNIVAVPAVALGFGGYFASLVGGDPTVIALGVILVCGAIVLSGIGQTIGLASLFAVIEAGGLLLVLFFGAPFLGDVDLLSLDHGVAGLFAGAALVFFAYEGFEEIATLSEEVRDPTRNIPRALLIAIAVTTVLYVAVAAVAVSVIPAATLSLDSSPLSSVVEVAAGARWGDALAVLALFATFNTVLLILATGPRAMYGMSQRGLLPRVIGLIWERRGTPWVGILIATVIGLLFSLTGDIGYVAQVTNFAVFALFVMVNASVIRLRWNQPERERPFRVTPMIGRLPLVPVLGLIGAVTLAAFMSTGALLTGAGALLAGFLASFVLLRNQAERTA